MLSVVRILGFFFLGAFLFTACRSEESENVNQDRIYTYYELYYNANQDKTYARAKFTFGDAVGTPLQLTEPAEVTIDGEPMTFKPLFSYYEKEFAGYKATGAFLYTDLDGITFENSVADVPEIAFTAELDTISRDSAFELFWVGDPLMANEFVGVFVDGENQGDAQLAGTENLGAQSVILPKNDLQQVGAGPGTIYMERNLEVDVTQGTSVGGRVKGRYRADNAAVYFK